MNREKRRITVGIIVGIFLMGVMYLWVRDGRAIKADSGYRLVMGTLARIVAVAADSDTAESCIEAALKELENIELLCSTYKVDSGISMVNRNAYKAPVRVSEPVFEVLQRAIKFSRISDGAFDVTIGPLMELWHSANDANCLPSDNELQQARSRVGYEKLILDANQMSVRFVADGMRIDLGGIAKGYGIDKAVEAMRRVGATGGMVDVGGDIRVFGAPPQGRGKWLIGLQNPDRAEESKHLLVLELTDGAVATSGGYRRFTLIEGKKYSHIIDTKTGSSSDKLTSVTIISKSATDADALATAVSVMGTEKGLALIESLPETEAILISSHPSFGVIKTRGAEKYTPKGSKLPRVEL